MSAPEYEALTQKAKVLSHDTHGPKVLELQDGSILKLFRRKRLLSSSLLWPYAKRFASGARVLQRKGIRCVNIHRVAKVPHLKRHIVIYDFLPGQTLRSLLIDAMDDPPTRDALLQQQAAFLANLHRQRIYFRAIHFNNIIVCTDGVFGLIDVSEVWSTPLPLNPFQRARNFRPMLKYPEDIAAVRAYGFTAFVNDYLDHANVSKPSKAIFNAWLSYFHRDLAHPTQSKIS